MSLSEDLRFPQSRQPSGSHIATVFLIQKAGVEVNLGNMQQGEVVALYNYMAQMIVELIKLASLIITLNKSAACAERVAAF